MQIRRRAFGEERRREKYNPVTGADTFETAAAHATRQVPVVEPSVRAGAVCQMLAGQRYDCASHVVVCTGERFEGLATIEDILGAPADASMASLMDTDAPVVGPGVDQEVAAWRAVHHGEAALAVVSGDGRFVGVIPPHRLVAVLLAEHEEDLWRLGGFLKMTSAARSTSEEPVHRRFRHRVPWLFLGLFGAMLTADLTGQFETLLQMNVMLAFFLPGIVYLADAVGTQTETVIVRGLSLGVPMRSMAGREMFAGLIIGLTLGGIVALLGWWRWEDANFAVLLGVSVFAATSTATLAAMALPWFLDRLTIDPAFGSGPLATVIQDLLSIWIYLTVMTLFL